MVPGMSLACTAVSLRAVPAHSNAQHADKGKGSDLEMTERSKARNKAEVAKEKHLPSYSEIAHQELACARLRHAGTVRCLRLGQKLWRLAARGFIWCCPGAVGATDGRKELL